MSLRGARDKTARILVFGYGNPGRQDDGAGVLLVEELEAWARAGGRTWLTFDSNYQLNAEDALAAAQQDVVIFTDACRDQPEGFRLRRIIPSAAVSFSTHAMSPESVLALSQELYGASPAAYILTIRGYQWEPNGTMTAEARGNLEAAKAFITPFLACPITGLPVPPA
ncbi:MAG: hydrogenase maturation protease [Spirochaetia bacterium]|jgi:hydrogenase maturation protease